MLALYTFKVTLFSMLITVKGSLTADFIHAQSFATSLARQAQIVLQI